MYPEIQERLFRELRAAYDTHDEQTSYERLQQLPYLDSVLKESMRLFPVAPFIVRNAIADTPISNCIIPKGAIIMMSIFNVQRVRIFSLIFIDSLISLILTVKFFLSWRESRSFGRKIDDFHDFRVVPPKKKSHVSPEKLLFCHFSTKSSIFRDSCVYEKKNHKKFRQFSLTATGHLGWWRRNVQSRPLATRRNK